MIFDHVLLVGFGGPEKPEEVWPFLLKLTEGTRIPEARLRVVAGHYEETGGFSMYNRHARQLASRIQPGLPVFLGMRAWTPFLHDVVREIAAKGLRCGLAIVLAPHRSEASFGRYETALQAACRDTGIEYAYLRSWHRHPLFVEAQTDRAKPLLRQEPQARLVFTAHSIPVEMARASSYEAEFQETSRLVAAALDVSGWSVAYQSRSGPPQQPWLEPDLLNELPRLRSEGARAVVVVPAGFLFDHTEVVYDLDIQAKQAAERQDLKFLRAPTVMDHPSFVRMFEELIQEQTTEGARR